jgi:hypothetical protein
VLYGQRDGWRDAEYLICIDAFHPLLFHSIPTSVLPILHPPSSPYPTVSHPFHTLRTHTHTHTLTLADDVNSATLYRNKIIEIKCRAVGLNQHSCTTCACCTVLSHVRYGAVQCSWLTHYVTLKRYTHIHSRTHIQTHTRSHILKPKCKRDSQIHIPQHSHLPLLPTLPPAHTGRCVTRRSILLFLYLFLYLYGTPGLYPRLSQRIFTHKV